ncbi:MAG: septum formation initiator family protein [Alphaproteobacteria bacterium]|nr:septum formation initiator family protein [Alphaproteobacteria bacterium]
MAVIDEIRYRARSALWPIVGALLLAYFSYHMVQGEQGVLSLLQLKTKVAQAEALHAGLRAERRELETRVALLRPDNLDPDMVEERARVMLNFAHPDEVVILQENPRGNIR